jgi:tRNA pseudouridine55 synthase
VATFLLGRRSDTDDVEGKVVEVANARRPSEGELDGALSQFVGEISQRPPDYSAVKVRGRRAYELARQGGRLDLEARSVRIDRIERLSYDYPELCLEIHCGSGTYVRALGRDLAVSLGTSAVLSALVRTAVGDFRLEDACSIEQIDGAELDTLLLPPTRIFAASSWVRLTDNDSRCVLRGERLHRPQHNISGVVAALDPHGRLVAVLAAEGGDWLRPEKVFPRSG